MYEYEGVESEVLSVLGKVQYECKSAGMDGDDIRLAQDAALMVKFGLANLVDAGDMRVGVLQERARKAREAKLATMSPTVGVSIRAVVHSGGNGYYKVRVLGDDMERINVTSIRGAVRAQVVADKVNDVIAAVIAEIRD